jgi:hypothetical protein
VLWSNVLAYRDVRLASRERMGELAKIGERFAGDGPTLINEYEPYAARYFLRKADPESPSELRRRVVPLRRGTGLDKLEWAPVDEFQPNAALEYRTVVLRRSPAESRPQPGYDLAFRGRYFDVWQRPLQPSRHVIDQVMFGDRLNATAPAPCPEVRRLQQVAESQGAILVAAERPPALILDLANSDRPPDWGLAPGTPARMFPPSAGTMRLSAQVPADGEYDLWMQGSFGRGLEASIDGSRVGEVRHELSFEGMWSRFGSVRLAAGTHQVELRYGGPGIRPGRGEQLDRFGPVALEPKAPAPRLSEVAPGSAQTLCGKSLDWLAVVGRG